MVGRVGLTGSIVANNRESAFAAKRLPFAAARNTKNCANPTTEWRSATTVVGLPVQSAVAGQCLDKRKIDAGARPLEVVRTHVFEACYSIVRTENESVKS